MSSIRDYWFLVETRNCSCGSSLCMDWGFSVDSQTNCSQIRITHSRETEEVMTGEAAHPNRGCSHLIKDLAPYSQRPEFLSKESCILI